jgi:CHASE3 domain sensor protein
MRFVDLKIRTKLGLAFGVLILTAILLSADTVYTLLSFRHKINSFTDEFLPQLKLSNSIGSQVQMVAFNMEGYYLTGQAEYFEKAKKQLDSLKLSLEKGVTLLENSTELDKLEQCLSEAKILIPQHEQNAMMAFKLFQDVEMLKTKVQSIQEKTTIAENQARNKKKKTVSTTPDKNSESVRVSDNLA